MGRIVFLNPFSATEITGGIKVVYEHAQILTALGHDVSIYQPDGPPAWLNIPDSLKICGEFEVAEDLTLIFPEVLQGIILQLAQMQMPAKKVMFCQNQYYLYSYGVDGSRLKEMGFQHFIVPGHRIAESLSSVLRVPNIHVIPLSLDLDLFYPRKKIHRIVTNPQKWQNEKNLPGMAHTLEMMLRLKYPSLASMPWIHLENLNHTQVAEYLGTSTIYLSLARFESVGLSALEAMASRCLVIGFHGIGGLEYASHRNGHWFSPEQPEEIVDCLAMAMGRILSQEPVIDSILDAGQKTANSYSREATNLAIARVYAHILDDLGPEVGRP